jgi:hypothetical protein
MRLTTLWQFLCLTRNQAWADLALILEQFIVSQYICLTTAMSWEMKMLSYLPTNRSFCFY